METENPTSQPVTLADSVAAFLAADTGLPSHNMQGDPLTTCRGCGVPIYAVASLGDQRWKCSGCRGVA